MLAALFGKENVSSVTRQMMAERSPSVTELNNQLINIVYDGEMTYLKDSSMEKTLVAGEPAAVRKLYESGTTIVQTNALFVEALNLEPKNRDKSPALQKRLARFRFPKIYRQDLAFHRQMVSEPMLGAFLSLLIDHYVREEEVAEALTLTRASMELQLDQVFLGSPILQYLEQLAATDPVALKRVEDGNMPVDTFLNSFKPWAQAQGMQERGDGDLLALMRTTFDIGWKTVRVNKVPTSRRTIKALRPEALMTLDQLKGPSNGKDESTQELGAGEADPDGTDGATQGSPQA
jgi:hypothetical protein